LNNGLEESVNKLILAAGCFAMSAAVYSEPAAAKSVHAEFAEAWQERGSRYEARYETAVDDANISVQAFSETIKAEGSPEEVQAAFLSMMQNIQAAAEIRSRGLLLNDLMEFIENKPSSEAGQMWLQGQVDILQDKIKQVDRLTSVADSMRENPELIALVDAVEKLEKARGEVNGHYAELQLLENNLTIYFAGRDRQASQNRVRWKGILDSLDSIGQSLQDQSARSISPSLNLRTNCRTYGGVTSCTTQ
jgi:hypothetical protein